MIIDKNIILEAKVKLGEQAIEIISNDLKLEEFDEKNLKSLCPFHYEKSGSFIWSQKDGGYFKCFGCGRVYGIIDHFIEFYKLSYPESIKKLFELTDTKYALGEIGVRSKREYKYPVEPSILDRTKVEKYMKTRKISKETLDLCNIMEDENGNIIFKYYDEANVLLSLKYRPSRVIKKGEPKMWFDKNYDNSDSIFNMNRVIPTKPLLITEGEIDTLAAIESGFVNSCSIPKGSQSMGWIESNFDFLQQFESIVVWFDADEAGRKAQKEVVHRLGTWKCKIVDPPLEFIDENNKKTKIKDINEVLYFFGKEKVIDCILNAQETPISNVIDFADIEDIDLQDMQGIYTGIKELDKKIMRLFFGTFNILSGSRGSGKSTLSNQLVIQALHQGYDTFIWSEELPNFQLKNWLLYNFAGNRHIETIRNKDQEDIFRIPKETKKKISEYYRDRMYIYDDDQDRTIPSLMKKMEELARRKGTKLFVLDNMSVVDFECNESEILRKQGSFILDLRNFAQKFNVIVVLIIHPTKLESFTRMTAQNIRGSGTIVDLAHRVLGCYRVTKKDKEGIKKQNGEWKTPPINCDVQVEVWKDRMNGFQDYMVDCFYDRSSRRFYTNYDEYAFNYSWDKTKYNDKLPYPQDQELPDFMRRNDE